VPTTTIACTHCGQTYELTPQQVPQYAGQTITCTACGRPFTVSIPAGNTYDLGPPPHVPAVPQVPQMPQAQATMHPGAYERQAAYAVNPPVAPPQSNGLAIASLIVGIVSFCIPLLGSLAAIVLGIVGLTRTKDPRVGGKGMAITGIVLGALSIVITPCFVSIMLPSLSRARETANRVKCASNMKQIGTALLLYANANSGVYPPDLVTLMNTTPGLSPAMMTCPSSMDTPAPNAATLNAGGHLSYIYLPTPSLRAMSSPAGTVVLYEPMTNHTDDGTNMLFADGHVEFVPKAKAQALIAAMQAGQNPPPFAQPGRAPVLRRPSQSTPTMPPMSDAPER